MNPYPAVKQVIAIDDYQLILTFSNKEKRLFDVKPYLNKGIFKELRNPGMFSSVHVSFDTIEWDNEADFDPEMLYKLSRTIRSKKYLNTNTSLSAAEPKAKYIKKQPQAKYARKKK